jgi:hypothetical protein
MARGQWLTPHQKGIVRRYYDHKNNLMTQKLGEIVSDLYLCKEQKQAARLWQSAHTALLNAGVQKARADSIMAARDLKRLAKVVSELF